ncbi:MAG: SurA N-terminal domain-containing protein [Bacteroidaceae bacterium]|nr:SurA N-terminal domain-containing protein [Bacteroidaceae bacterium]
MATLQKIRSKGTLLLVVIGLALLAFILGDAWKILRPNQGVATVGEVNGISINAQDFQNEFEKYAEIVKFSMNLNSLTDEQYASVKDETWNNIIRKSILEKETSALGLRVTDAEIQSIIEAGTNPMLRQTPFVNEQTGMFDVDRLKMFLAEYNEIDRASLPAEYMNYYDNLYNFWCYVEDNIRQNLLLSKYAALIQTSMLSNPVSRKDAYETRARRNDILLATLPYSTVPDSLAKVSAADVQKLYAEKKPMYRQQEETRNISYIDVEILPSESDRKSLLDEVTAYATQLAETNGEYASFVRLAESSIAYSEVPSSKNGLPADVAERLDSVSVGGVFGPYYCAEDDSYNTFKLISVTNAYDSVQFSLIQVNPNLTENVAGLADSIYNAVKAGADMVGLAAKYSQNGEPQWLASASYEGGTYSGNDAEYLCKMNTLAKGDVCKLDLDQVSLIIKVSDVRNRIRKYNTAIVKRAAYFSNETSNEAYNKLSAFVASNNTAELLAGNAEENGYRLLADREFRSNSNNVGGVSKSHDALRWVFEAKPGEVSRIYEVGEDNNHLLVVALNKIAKKGYKPVDDVKTSLIFEATDAKKAEILLGKIADAGSLSGVDGVRYDTLKYVTFSSPAYVSSTYSSERLVGAAVCNLENGASSAPIKGDGGVWVAKKISADAYSADYDDATEKSRYQSNAAYITNMVFSELYSKANVTDNRYRIF